MFMIGRTEFFRRVTKAGKRWVIERADVTIFFPPRDQVGVRDTLLSWIFLRKHHNFHRQTYYKGDDETNGNALGLWLVTDRPV